MNIQTLLICTIFRIRDYFFLSFPEMESFSSTGNVSLDQQIGEWLEWDKVI